MKNLIILISFLLLMISVSAQVDYSTNCKYFEITKMQFDQTAGKDTLYVTVYNDCDTCGQSVYTGIIVYRGEFISLTAVEDTLAIDRYWTAERTPENNAERTYTAIVKKDFDLSLKNFKVGLLGVCDSIPLSPDVILSIKEENIKEKQIVILQSNGVLTTEPGQAIKDISIYNLAGQLVQKRAGIFSSEYRLNALNPGMYLISVVLQNNEQVSLKYLKENY
jgi:hypothetical protein